MNQNPLTRLDDPRDPTTRVICPPNQGHLIVGIKTTRHSPIILVQRAFYRGAPIPRGSEANLYNSQSGAIIQTFKGGVQRQVSAIELSDDGLQVLVGAGGYRHFSLTQLYRTDRREKIDQWKQLLFVKALAFSPDGSSFAVGSGNSPRRFEQRTGKVLWVSNGKTVTFAAESRVEAASFSPDGCWLATGTASGVVQLYRVAGTQAAHNWSTGYQVKSLEFAADSGLLLVLGEAAEPILIDMNAPVRPVMRKLDLASDIEISHGKLAADGRYLYLGGRVAKKEKNRYLGVGMVVDLITNSRKQWLQSNAISAIALSFDGKMAAMASSGGPAGGKRDLFVLDTAKREVTQRLQHPSAIYALAFSHTGDLLVGDATGQITVLSVNTP